MIMRQCLECARPYIGRSDKKFCGDHCRSIHHNRQSQSKLSVIKNVNNILTRNRNALAELFTDHDHSKIVRVHREMLISAGFDFSYITDTIVNRQGSEYRYCYDYGYLDVGRDYFMIVQKRTESLLVG
jgi:hypothetical protein